MPHPHAPETFDELDPHGETKVHAHGHVIIPMRVLVGVLMALLVFTLVTVFASRFEIMLIEDFGVPIPHWVNVAVALSIALVKSTLVAMYFMQLRYDNPLNTLVLLFCLFAFSLFLGFSTLDLGTRDVVYPWKAGEIERGGTQLNITRKADYPRTDPNRPRGYPIAEWAADRYRAKLHGQALAIVDAAIKTGGQVELPEHKGAAHGPVLAETVRDTIAELQATGELADLELQRDFLVNEVVKRQYLAEQAAHKKHGAPIEHVGPASDANKSRPRRGPTPGLLDPAATHSATPVADSH